MQLKEIAGPHVLRIGYTAMASASTDNEVGGVTVPFDCVITAAKWVPLAAVVADGTNFSTLGVRNRKADASGAAIPATRAYSATNSVAFVPEAMTLSATAADLLLAAGDVLTARGVHSGTGVVIPAGTVELTLQAR